MSEQCAWVGGPSFAELCSASYLSTYLLTNSTCLQGRVDTNALRRRAEQRLALPPGSTYTDETAPSLSLLRSGLFFSRHLKVRPNPNPNPNPKGGLTLTLILTLTSRPSRGASGGASARPTTQCTCGARTSWRRASRSRSAQRSATRRRAPTPCCRSCAASLLTLTLTTDSDPDPDVNPSPSPRPSPSPNPGRSPNPNPNSNPVPNQVRRFAAPGATLYVGTTEPPSFFEGTTLARTYRLLFASNFSAQLSEKVDNNYAVYAVESLLFVGAELYVETYGYTRGNYMRGCWPYAARDVTAGGGKTFGDVPPRRLAGGGKHVGVAARGGETFGVAYRGACKRGCHEELHLLPPPRGARCDVDG